MISGRATQKHSQQGRQKWPGLSSSACSIRVANYGLAASTLGRAC